MHLKILKKAMFKSRFSSYNWIEQILTKAQHRVNILLVVFDRWFFSGIDTFFLLIQVHKVDINIKITDLKKSIHAKFPCHFPVNIFCYKHHMYKTLSFRVVHFLIFPYNRCRISLTFANREFTLRARIMNITSRAQSFLISLQFKISIFS